MDSYGIKSVVDMLGDNVLKLSGKTILWTGTSGFLGQWVIRLIKYLNNGVLSKPCKLLAYDMHLPDGWIMQEFAGSGIVFCSHDLTTKFWPVAEPIDYVVHMAGIASPYHYQRRPLETIDVAIEGTRSTLEIARHHGARFLFTSSSEVYQTASVVPTPETYVGAIPSDNDRSCYDVSKLMAENLTYVYHKNLGIDASCIRIFNSFGPGIAEQDSRILPRIASAIIGRFPISVYSTGVLPTRTYCPTGNTIAGMFLALLNGKPGENYNIGIDTPEITVPELIGHIKASCGLQIPYNVVKPKEVYATEPLRRCPDITKARMFLDYKPTISLDAGLRLFFDWALKNYSGQRVE